MSNFSCVLGNDCENDYDACALGPCSVGRNCTDREATVHAATPTLTAYTCTPCPDGYRDDGSKCDG